MRRQARGLIFLGVIFAVAITLIAIPRIDFSIGSRSFDRGDDDTLLGLTLGLDLQGGTHLVYQAEKEGGVEPTLDDMEAVRRTISSRVNQFGLSEPTVQLLGNPPDKVLIQIPGLAGATISVGFVGNTVDAADLEAFFRSELGHPEAVVTTDVDDAGAELLVVKLDEVQGERLDPDGNVLQDAEADLIRPKIGERFPARLRILYNAPSTTGTSTPEFETPTVDGIREILGGIGRGDSLVEQSGALSFRAFLANPIDDSVDEDGNVTEGEVTRLRRLFNERFGPPFIFALSGQIAAYTVGGGVQEAKQLIGETAQLEFRERECGPFLDPNDGTEFPPDGLSLNDWLTQRCTNPIYYSETTLPLTGANLVNAFAGTQPGIPRPVVNIEFDGQGSSEFFEVTDRIARTRGLLAIYLDGEELVAPSAQQGISGGRAFIQGPDFTAERSRTIAIQLKSGALPVQLKLIQERNVDATLGGDTLRKSVVAGIVGLSLVLAYMVIYYKMPGVVAGLSLILYASILLAIFKMAPVTLTLSGIAALILTIGTAVDANVLISERTKEELRAGRTLFAAINEGFARAWPSIRDSNAATIISSIVLFWFGGRLGTSVMQGFALTLGIGTLVSMFTAFFASRVISRSLASTALGNRMTLWVPVGEVGADRVVRTGQASEPGD